MEGKRIEVVTMRVSDLKHEFGNPRKITKKKKAELKNSLETFGDFGLFLIDEDNNLLGGSQRQEILSSLDPDTEVLCKRLIGYTEAEKRAVNIKDNTHSGEWDLDILANWTADLNFDLGIKDDLKKELEERKIKEMELIHYEKYDYVMIVCRNEIDYNNLVRNLGLDDKKAVINQKSGRTIKARAVWYDQIQGQIIGRITPEVSRKMEDQG